MKTNHDANFTTQSNKVMDNDYLKCNLSTRAQKPKVKGCTSIQAEWYFLPGAMHQNFNNQKYSAKTTINSFRGSKR